MARNRATNGCRLLLASLFTPPSSVSATRRPAALTRELGRLGFQVTVLTSVISGSGEIEGAQRVVRTRDLLTTRFNWRRGNVEALKGDTEAAYDATPSRLAQWMVADMQLTTWIPFAVPRALAMHAETPFDSVVTTGPPHSTHFIGLALREKGVPWIADLQDGWSFERPTELRAGLVRSADLRVERFVLGRADAVAGVTDAMANDARDRFDVRAFTIHLGFDPDETEAAEELAPAQRDEFFVNGKHSLLYTGSMAYSGLSPAQLLEGVRRLRRESPAAAARLEIVFAGPTSSQERELFADPEVSPNIRLLGTLPRDQVLALQRAADSLLVIIDDRRLGITTNKLFEYLSASKPILVLGEGSEAGKIVEQLGAGLVVSSDDPAAIAAGLEALLDGQVPTVAPNGELDRYSHPVLAGRFAKLIEDSIASHETRSS